MSKYILPPIEEALEIINLLDTYLVHCKDCENWDDDLEGYCTINDCFNWDADDFCSRGERINGTQKTD